VSVTEQLWSNRHGLGAVSALTRHGFRGTLEMWGGGRWPECEAAISNTSAGDLVRADLADADTIWPTAGRSELPATDGGSARGIGIA
jgi:hypothetical protein